MDQLYRRLKPLANVYIILLSWFLMVVNFYLCLKPMYDYAASAGLKTTPTILDTMTYYTPDEGYQALTNLREGGRQAYRLANYFDFILPILLFLALSLPNVAMEKRSKHIIAPFLYMISDYMENLAQKYVLDIYPKRNDFIMTLACYFGIMKFITLFGSALIMVINGLKWMFQSKQKIK